MAEVLMMPLDFLNPQGHTQAQSCFSTLRLVILEIVVSLEIFIVIGGR